jgi:hypothetical protein
LMSAAETVRDSSAVAPMAGGPLGQQEFMVMSFRLG